MDRVSLDGVVSIHASEAASLCETRRAQARLPHVNLESLGRLDDRLLAHFDGLAVAGPNGQHCIEAEVESPTPGAIFVAAVSALERREPASLGRLWEMAPDAPFVAGALALALGWVGPECLRGVVKDLLTSAAPGKRVVGLTACSMHRADPGLETGPWLADPEAAVRASALRTAGELGLRALTPRCVAALTDDDPSCQFWAAWSAVLLGSRDAPLETLGRVALDIASPHRHRAFCLAFQALSAASAHAKLQTMAPDPGQAGWLVRGTGLVGDVAYMPWLLSRMEAPDTARQAGEAFTLITGADLDEQQLWRQPPEDDESGPTEEPEDEDVGLDPDDGLMWPDVDKVRRWWGANESRFQAGTRYFLGAPVARTRCVEVLKRGYQRQRILAAQHLCLVEPGTPLFDTRAPAWRQHRWLDRL